MGSRSYGITHASLTSKIGLLRFRGPWVHAMMTQGLMAKSGMGLFKKNKERERYYLLPGMGGKNLWRKQKVILRWTLAAGLVTAGVFAAVLYLISRG